MTSFRKATHGVNWIDGAVDDSEMVLAPSMPARFGGKAQMCCSAGSSLRALLSARQLTGEE